MVKIATSVLAAALFACPVLAISEQYERSLTETDLYDRDFTVEDIVVTREDLDTFFGREFVSDIEERSPFGLGLLFKGIKAAVKIGKGAHKAHHVVGNNNNNNNNHRREFDGGEFDLREFEDDLEAREPFGFGTAVKGFRTASRLGRKAHHLQGYIPQTNQNDQQSREFDDDLEAREPFGFGTAIKGFRTVAKLGHKAHDVQGYIPQNNQNDEQSREFEDDLEAREPFGFGAAVKGIRGAARLGHKVHHHVQGYMPQSNQDEQRREIDVPVEVFEREFDYEDLLERDFDELD